MLRTTMFCGWTQKPETPGISEQLQLIHELSESEGLDMPLSYYHDEVVLSYKDSGSLDAIGKHLQRHLTNATCNLFWQ